MRRGELKTTRVTGRSRGGAGRRSRGGRGVEFNKFENIIAFNKAALALGKTCHKVGKIKMSSAGFFFSIRPPPINRMRFPPPGPVFRDRSYSIWEFREPGRLVADMKLES